MCTGFKNRMQGDMIQSSHNTAMEIYPLICANSEEFLEKLSNHKLLKVVVAHKEMEGHT
jgi:hypothetical protein